MAQSGGKGKCCYLDATFGVAPFGMFIVCVTADASGDSALSATFSEVRQKMRGFLFENE